MGFLRPTLVVFVFLTAFSAYGLIGKTTCF